MVPRLCPQVIRQSRANKLLPAAGNLGPEGGLTFVNVLAGLVAPCQPSGTLKSTDICSDLSEPAFLCDTDNRRISSDISGPLCGKPNGTTPHAQVTTTRLPAGVLRNKKRIFITGASDARTFLAWLRSCCPCGLTAQIKGENLTLVPSIADGLRAVFGAMWPLDEGRV